MFISRKRFCAVLLALMLFLPVIGNSAEVTLAANGRPTATIVIAEKPTRAAQLAVAEFNCYLKKITGAALPVISDKQKVSGDVVLIGESRATQDLGLHNSDFKEQEYLIQTRPGMLILIGFDSANYGAIDYAGSGFWDGWGNSEWYTERTGSIYAVDDFLRKFCNIRWYLPGELGEVVPRKETLKFSGLNFRHQPWLLDRDMAPFAYDIPQKLYIDPEEPITDSLELFSRRETNLFWLRQKACGEGFVATHAFGEWPARFGKTHPEYFALQADGTRSFNQLCYSSEAVIKQIIEDLKVRIAGEQSGINRYGRNKYVTIAPGDTNDWCQCDTCRAQFDPKRAEEFKQHFSNGYASNYVWNFTNRVAREVSKIAPGKIVTQLAYWDYYLPPDIPGFKLEPNIAVCICRTNLTQIGKSIYDDKYYSKDVWKHWRGLTPNLYFWEYYCFPQLGKNNVFPAIVPHRIAESLQFQQSIGTRGIFWELNGIPHKISGRYLLPSPAMDSINFYVTMRLADDINQDVDEVLVEYYRLFYGPAEKPMKAFFNKMEEIYTNYPILKGHLDAETSWAQVCPPPLLEELGKFIKEAQALAKEEPYKSRVELMDKAIYQWMATNSKYTRLLMGLK